MGDGRAERSSAIGDGGQAAISLMPHLDGMYVRIFESLQLDGSYVGDLLYLGPSVNPEQSHFKIFNLITSAKTLCPNEVTFTGTEGSVSAHQGRSGPEKGHEIP